MARGGATDGRRRIVEVLGEQVEALTRLRAADLREDGPETVGHAELIVTTRQRIEFEARTEDHPGPAPEGSGAGARPDAAALEQELARRLADAERAAPEHIQAWVADEDGAYRRLLPAARFLPPASPPAAATLACPDCAGQGRAACGDCQGRGVRPCEDCRGLGRLPCPTCAATPAPPAAPGTAAAPCPDCHGGWRPCGPCEGRGETRCRPCEGTGRRDCPACAATGQRHRIGRIEVRIEVEDRIECPGADPALAAALLAWAGDGRTLADRVRVEQVRTTVAPLAVQTVHRLSVEVRQAVLLAGTRRLGFTALGPQAEPLDRQAVISALLEQDLVILERQAGGSGGHLGEALQRVMESPAHRRIVAGDAVAEDLVSAEHAARTRAAVAQGAARLWQQAMRRPTRALVAASGIAAGAAVMLAGPAVSPILAAAGAWTAAALLGLIADRLACRQVNRRLAGGEVARLLPPPHQPGPRRRMALQALAAGGVAAVAAGLGASRLPWVRARSEARAQAQALDAALDRWSASGKDHRLRAYPDDDLLEQAVARGDTRAAVVLGWKRLVAPGGSVDAAAVRDLFDQAARTPPADPRLAAAVVIGQARLALPPPRGRPSPADLQAAIARLDDLGHGAALPPEGLYTLALLHLARPAVGTVAGLAALQQAADAGHPGACLDLGRRLAAGQGLPRDTAAARRYITFAAGKGVPEAGLVLASLR